MPMRSVFGRVPVRVSGAAALVAAGTILYACSDASVTGSPPPPVCHATNPLVTPATFYLATLNGAFLPIPIFGHTSVLGSARLDLGSDSTYRLVQLHRAPHTGPDGLVTDSASNSGTYSLCSSRITLSPTSVGGANYIGDVRPGSISLVLPSDLISNPPTTSTSILVFAADSHNYICGDDPIVPSSSASGVFTLSTIGPHAVPDTLIETYPTTVVVTSGTASIDDSTYHLRVLGRTSDSGDSVVTVVADSGASEACAGSLKIVTSLAADSAFQIQTSDSLVVVPLPPDFVGYGYNSFAGDTESIELLFRRNP